jgi:hypothetical protein
MALADKAIRVVTDEVKQCGVGRMGGIGKDVYQGLKGWAVYRKGGKGGLAG